MDFVGKENHIESATVINKLSRSTPISTLLILAAFQMANCLHHMVATELYIHLPMQSVFTVPDVKALAGQMYGLGFYRNYTKVIK